MAEIYMGTGRRKTSVARVYLKPGTGKITINDQEYNDLNDYFENKIWTLHAIEPLRTVGLEGSFDLFIRVEGGGKSGQAGAVRLGIARALVAYNPDLRPILREKGYLTRDPRMVERKKYGLKKARRAPQFSKR
ncbi:30S ribosomal protein S9 [Fervidobacterium thailandense]|uniref:Small ribosomal subunit protein uS9 n=1 Tax=Fervidobacterium thailandense TaxID=1008305 RepID=A0A1E3G1A3_9BACT|nr:30S ribosomal protein S9 [Fervidobacterium thailandense]ODN30031.1 30S ribosomal protein S9 [Fervidobacterium thailandense]